MNIIRTTLEHISRTITLKRQFSMEFNQTQLIVSPGASLSYWKPGLDRRDPMLIDIVKRFIKPGQVVWDIGANVGLFAFAAATKAQKEGRVLAVEADTWLVSLLHRSSQLRANRDLNVDILPVAISDRVGIASFNIAQRGRATNFLASANGSSQTGGVRETQLVPCVTLDWLSSNYEPPDFVKIDIEGAELLALSGADNLLSRDRPVILVEVSGANQQAATELFSRIHYTLYNAQNMAAGPIKSSTFNTLALPEEKMTKQYGLSQNES